jgi:hypothetical protein
MKMSQAIPLFYLRHFSGNLNGAIVGKVTGKAGQSWAARPACSQASSTAPHFGTSAKAGSSLKLPTTTPNTSLLPSNSNITKTISLPRLSAAFWIFQNAIMQPLCLHRTSRIALAADNFFGHISSRFSSHFFHSRV